MTPNELILHQIEQGTILWAISWAQMEEGCRFSAGITITPVERHRKIRKQVNLKLFDLNEFTPSPTKDILSRIEPVSSVSYEAPINSEKLMGQR